jgi:hypothetical protein
MWSVRASFFDHLVAERDAFRIVLLEPFIGKLWRREHLEVIDVANFLAGIDIDLNRCHSSRSLISPAMGARWSLGLPHGQNFCRPFQQGAQHSGTLAHHLRFFAFAPSEIPTQVVVPSVSLAARLQGTALTVFVVTPSGPTMFKPGPIFTSGNGPPKGSADGVPDVADPPVPDVAGVLVSVVAGA